MYQMCMLVMYMVLIMRQDEVCGVCTPHPSMCEAVPSLQLVKYNLALLKREAMQQQTTLLKY